MDRAELVTITTVDGIRPAENKGFAGANTPKIVYLLIPSCGSRVSGPGLYQRWESSKRSAFCAHWNPWTTTSSITVMTETV